MNYFNQRNWFFDQSLGERIPTRMHYSKTTTRRALQLCARAWGEVLTPWHEGILLETFSYLKVQRVKSLAKFLTLVLAEWSSLQKTRMFLESQIFHSKERAIDDLMSPWRFDNMGVSQMSSMEGGTKRNRASQIWMPMGYWMNMWRSSSTGALHMGQWPLGVMVFLKRLLLELSRSLKRRNRRNWSSFITRICRCINFCYTCKNLFRFFFKHVFMRHCTKYNIIVADIMQSKKNLQHIAYVPPFW